jgi:5-methyltetrahydropteroyltriglutamate--homocysteine methyltransferase
MKRSTDRILTTHVGSLIRPKTLLDTAKDQAAHERELARAVTQIVALQAKAGIDVVNDGEFGKSGWANYALERMTGFERRPDTLYPAVWLGRDRIRFAEFMAAEFPRGVTGTPGHACVGPISYQGHASVRRDLANLKAAAAATPAADVFFTAVAPASVGYDARNEHYANERDYVFAIADALREEYLEVHKSGVVLQVDDAVLANMYDHLVAQSPQKYREWAELRIDALNHALEGIPEDRIRYHVCFGSWHVPHVADAALEDIVDLVLTVRAGAYSIEAANVRHEHEWRVWQKVKLPPCKILIPGVVTHHTTTVEHPRVVADRIVNFARLVGRENVIAGTDCGFAQGETIQRVHPQVMWAKLESLAEGARIASRELWDGSARSLATA